MTASWAFAGCSAGLFGGAACTFGEHFQAVARSGAAWSRLANKKPRKTGAFLMSRAGTRTIDHRIKRLHSRRFARFPCQLAPSKTPAQPASPDHRVLADSPPLGAPCTSRVLRFGLALRPAPPGRPPGRRPPRRGPAGSGSRCRG